MFLHHCISLWLCSVTVQMFAVYLIYLVKSHSTPANERSDLNEITFANLIDVPRPMVSGPFGTLFFPPNDDSYQKRHAIENVALGDRKPDDSFPPSLFSILFASPVGLYLICSFIPLISLCLVAALILFIEKEQNAHLRNRPDMLEAGLLQYDQLEPAVEPLRRRIRFPCRTWGG